MAKFNKLMVVALMNVWRRNIGGDRRSVEVICDNAECITDDDYPIPKKWCPPLDGMEGCHSGVMIHRRSGHDII